MSTFVLKPEKEKTDFVFGKYNKYRQSEISRKDYIKCEMQIVANAKVVKRCFISFDI